MIYGNNLLHTRSTFTKYTCSSDIIDELRNGTKNTKVHTKKYRIFSPIIVLFGFALIRTKIQKNAGIINRNRNNSASCTDNKRITLKISEIREIAI